MLNRAVFLASLAGVAAMLAGGCSKRGSGEETTVMGYEYEVVRVAEPITIDANWDKPAWQDIQPLELTHHMGDKPDHFPKVQAKLAYDAENIYVIFRVDDRYVRAVAPHHQGMVCRDSCAEFFFAPGMDVSKGYFNLEMNCGGTMLLHFQVIPRKDMVPLTDEELATIEVAASQPRIVDPEITEPTTWFIEYRLPVAIVDKYLPDAAKPAPGVQWRANFFKCADDTSHPHWLTWAKVNRERPDFHVPEDFGVLVFKK